MPRILHSLLRIGHRLGAILSKKTFFSPPPAVVDHDPGASRPHDLDDPFFDARVQRRVAAVIAGATQDKSRQKR